MSGPISDMPVILCRDCGAFYIPDERMFTDIEMCLVCCGEVGGVSAGIYFESLWLYDENGDLTPADTVEASVNLARLLHDYDENGDIIGRNIITSAIIYDTCWDYDENGDLTPR
jgi:hypothetical protein